MTKAPSRARLVRPLVIAAVTAAVLTVTPAAQSAKPAHVSFPVEVSYEIEELTALCGVTVIFSLEGTFKGTLFRNANGVITGEFDSQPNTWFELSSPDTGKSIRNPFATRFHNKYPEGVDPGDRVIATATGYIEKLPGLHAMAERAYFPNGVVLFLDDGVPIVDYGEPTRVNGTGYSGEEADAAICAHLTDD